MSADVYRRITETATGRWFEVSDPVHLTEPRQYDFDLLLSIARSQGVFLREGAAALSEEPTP